MIIAARYEVMNEIGSGLWANVYKVRDIRTNKIYALKLFQRLNSATFYEKCKAEQMHHIVRIEHPNLIQIFDFSNSGDNIFHISEYFESRTLKNFRFNPDNYELLYDIVVQICYGLSALHSQKIIHKNLKPENILYTYDEQELKVKLNDYGFMKIDFESDKQKINQIVPFVAPELYRGGEAKPQSDFYSLGAILYRLTTGVLPYTLDRITSFIKGEEKNLIPKFPREINPSIPSGLETLILKMLEIGPDDRFYNAEAIVSHINSIQLKQYPFSHRWTVENAVRFSDYLVREDYSHQLLDFLPIVEKGNGKIIKLVGGKGLGKNNCLTLFRYHILSDQFYIFDYECKPLQNDPFFALIKEFYHAVKKNKKIANDLIHLSAKLQKYLFDSEEIARLIQENEQELSIDFTTVEKIIVTLSEEKPLIFILRGAQYLKKESIDFINFLSNLIVDKKVMIIISTNDPSKVKKIIHPINIKIEPLTFDQTKNYVEQLLKIIPSQDFLQKLWIRSYGNPLFIKLILLELIKSRKIYKKDKDEFDFNYDLHDFVLPMDIKHMIYEKMSHLIEKNYHFLQKLALVQTPLSKSLIRYILGLDDKTLMSLLQGGLDNEILRLDGTYYYFTYVEAKERFIDECTEDDRRFISEKIKTYFEQKQFSSVAILEGVIEHVKFIEDYQSVRFYKLKLVELYTQQGEYEQSFLTMCHIVEMYFMKQVMLSQTELKKDLQSLLHKSEWAVNKIIPESLKWHILQMEEISEKYLIIGVFYLVMEKTRLAQSRLERALQLAYTGKQQMEILLYLTRLYYDSEQFDSFEKCILQLEKMGITSEYEITLIELKALYLFHDHRTSEAILLIEEFLPNISSQNEPFFFVRLGSLYNVLGFLYHQQRMLAESSKYFHVARKMWEKIKYQRKLVKIYNNIGDVALVQGDPQTALINFRHAIKICSQIDCKTGSVQSLLNHGEAYIKLGQFDDAELFLNQAKKRSESISIHPFYKSIINNMAIAKSKIYSFSYYRNFIGENAPDLINEQIQSITPLTKTYFYYLYNIGDYEKIERLLKNLEMFVAESKAYEFYYQMLGYLYLQKKDYEASLEYLDLAFKYSQQSNSVYAQAINYIRLAECFIQIPELTKANEMYMQAEAICNQYEFLYWKFYVKIIGIKLKLQKPDTSFRHIIRETLSLLKSVNEYHFYIQEIMLLGILTQVYATLKMKSKSEEYFSLYKQKIAQATDGLNEREKNIFEQKTFYHETNYYKFIFTKIVPRLVIDSDIWQEELYNIIKIRNNDRIKYSIQQSIDKLFSPHSFAIILQSELKYHTEPFLMFNVTPRVLYSEMYQKNISLALETQKIVIRRIEHKHVLFVPLRLQQLYVGCFIITDNGEMSFTKSEKTILNIIKFHFTSILVRIKEFSELNSEMNLLSDLIEISQNFFKIEGSDKLEQDIVSYALEFVQGSRGFLIIKDEFQNYVYRVAVDDTRNIVLNYTYISKIVLSDVQNGQRPILVQNAKSAGLFEGYTDYDFSTLSIYCVPIFVQDSIYGYLYIDNLYNSDKKLVINKELMSLLLKQISLSLQNMLDYEGMREKMVELHKLSNLKNDFSAIVSHELKTPITNIQSYVHQLKKMTVEEKKSEIINILENNVTRLNDTVTNIINYIKYKMVTDLVKIPFDISDILPVIVHEIENHCVHRHMRFQLAIEENIPKVSLNWESFQLVIENIIYNSVRFTKDFGTINIGARKSSFEKEEIDSKESLLIYIQDNGIGIPSHELKNIFQHYYEINDIYSRHSGLVDYKSSGLGLGLATAKLIIELHHGKIWVESKEAEGTTVFIGIPVAEVNELESKL
jgi:signal transduction histidine kinase/tetratricopeptide (TPR) repeat protein/tRNA A-37 threonylcarbamoyl transferase component Bud32